MTIYSTEEATLKLDLKRERAKKAFGAWSKRNDIKDGARYVSDIREEWNKRSKRDF